QMNKAEAEQAKRSALLDRISALLAKTRENGCTEAEAIAAAELADKLMSKYGLSLGELEAVRMPVDVCEVQATAIGQKRCHEVVHLLWTIAWYCNCKSWYQPHGVIHLDKDRRRIHQEGGQAHHGVIGVFFGLAADVQVALWLCNTLRVAMDTEWQAYWRS